MSGTDTLSPLDRYPGSPDFGKPVNNVIFLWKEAGTGLLDGELTGALKPHTEVEVFEWMVIGANIFARVQAEQGGRMQAGWCSIVFLEQAGAEYLTRLYGETADE